MTRCIKGLQLWIQSKISGTRLDRGQAKASSGKRLANESEIAKQRQEENLPLPKFMILLRIDPVQESWERNRFSDVFDKY